MGSGKYANVHLINWRPLLNWFQNPLSSYIACLMGPNSGAVYINLKKNVLILPLTLKIARGLSDRATLMFPKFDMQQRHKSHSDIRHDHFLNLTGDMGINKRQRHVTSAFLKIDRQHGHPPSRSPLVDILSFIKHSPEMSAIP